MGDEDVDWLFDEFDTDEFCPDCGFEYPCACDEEF